MSVLIDPRLIPICERSMPGIEFLPAAKGSSLEDRFDYQLPMGSLPRLFRNSEEDFNRTRQGYFKADMTRVEQLRKELGVEDTLINLKGLTPGMLVTLGEQKIINLKDFAELASDELIGGYDEKKGKRYKVDGYLEEFALSKAEADELIMNARNIVFK